MKDLPAQLRDSDHLFRLLVDSASDYAIFTQSLDHRVATWNSGAERLMGYAEDEIVGKSGDIVFVPEDREAGAPQREAQTALESGRCVNERWHLTKTGQRFWGSGLMFRLDGDDGQPIGFAKIMRDQTLEKRLDDEVRALNRELEDRVAQRTSQLRQLATQMSQVEEEERRRLATVLHDHLQQLLVAAKLRVNSVRKFTSPEGMRRIADAESNIDEAIAASRELTIELSPPVLTREGLGAALHWLAASMQQMHSLEVAVHIKEDPPNLPFSIKVFAFRAVRELLLNVVKHAQTNQAIVTVSDGKTLKVTVEDAGVGYDPTQASATQTAGGFGLFSIQERLTTLGGSIDVDSHPGEGTRVTFQLPLPPDGR